MGFSSIWDFISRTNFNAQFNKTRLAIVAALLGFISSCTTTDNKPVASDRVKSDTGFTSDASINDLNYMDYSSSDDSDYDLDYTGSLSTSDISTQDNSDFDNDSIIVEESEEKDVEDYTLVQDYKPFDPSEYRIFFEFDDDSLSETHLKILDRIIEGMKRDPLVKLNIFGNSDKQGPKTYNYDLSKKRAKKIWGYMTSNGIDESRLIITAKGESEPLVLGNTVKSYKKNRRGEFSINLRYSVFGNAD